MSKSKIRRVAVLGSGTAKEQNPVYHQAMKLGEALAQADFTIYHGGYGGVMEAVARGSRSAGGRNVGVTIRKSLKGANRWADAEIKKPSWQERLFELIEMGDAYIFLDGATGTLNELFFVWEMTNKRILKKPVLILGKRLHKLVKFLKKDPSLKVPDQFYLIPSIPKAIEILKNGASMKP